MPFGRLLHEQQTLEARKMKREQTPREKVKSRVFTSEEIDYIYAHRKGTETGTLLKNLNERFGKSYTYNNLMYFCGRYAINSGLDTRFNAESGKKTRFKKGYESPYKGMTLKERGYSDEALEKIKMNLYQKGHIAPNALPIGSIVQDQSGYYKKKIAARKWDYLHRLIYQEAHGAIPKGFDVIFLDGDRSNIKLENLRLVDNRINGKRRKYGAPANTEIGEAIIALSTLDAAIDDKKKRRKRKNG